MARLEHIGIAIDDVAHVVDILVDLLGESPYQAETLAEDGIRTHFIWGGSAKLELLEEVGDRSAVRAFLERRGPGLHHLAFEVDDIHAIHERARRGGYDPVEDEPREGADGKRIFFLHPKQTAGVLIEFCQSVRPALEPTSVPEVAGLRGLSVARGSTARAACVYLFESAASMDLGAFAAQLRPGRCFYAAEAAPPLRVTELLDALDRAEFHLAADASLIRAAIETADDRRLRSLTLIDPDESDVDRIVDIQTDLLVLTRADEHGLRLGSNIRSRMPTARLAVTTDFELRLAIIASHFEQSRP